MGIKALKICSDILTGKYVYRIFKKNSLKFLLLVIAFFTHAQTFSQVDISPGIKKETFEFAKRDTSLLKLDVYTPTGITKNNPCVIFVFGGGFITGRRDEKFYNKYFNTLVQNKYVVVSISYRLGLKGGRRLTNFNTKPLKTAVDKAVEDLFDATKWVIKNSTKIGIDTTKIILSGSSAGAMVVLQGDFEKRNKTDLAKMLSDDFQYAGVIAFAGAVISDQGRLRYKINPAPTMMFHGTRDKMIFYNRLSFFNRSLNGSNQIASVFRKHNYPYYFYRVVGMGHEVAARPMEDNLENVLWFLEQYVMNKKHYQIEHTFRDMDSKHSLILSPDDIFKEKPETISSKRD